MTIFLATIVAAALYAVEPETCVVPGGSIIVEHSGRTYAVASMECRDLFLIDPERYSQLFDALIELQEQGKNVTPPQPSLVPS